MKFLYKATFFRFNYGSFNKYQNNPTNQDKNCLQLFNTDPGKVLLANRVFASNSLHKKMKFSIKDFFSKCDQIRRKLRIWSHLLKKSLVENFLFCAVLDICIFILGITNTLEKLLKKTLPSRKFQNKYILGFRYIKKNGLMNCVVESTPLPPTLQITMELNTVA